ncbi:hypothetical protein [Kocuria dechangensis]|nr:hypothetical protein [Kocuria dechangensis]
MTSAVGTAATARSGCPIGSAVYSPTHHNELEDPVERVPDPEGDTAP